MSLVNPLPRTKPLVFFIHLPRTGGTTFQVLLADQFSRDEILYISSLEEVRALASMPEAKKNKLRFLHGHVGFAADKELPQPHYNVTFLRDPVARVTSVYQYIRSNPQHTHHRVVAERRLTLSEFVAQRVSPVNIDNGMTRILCGLPNNAMDVEFGQCTQAMLDTAKRNLRERTAVIGLTEQYDASLVLMRRRFGWKSPLYSIKNTTKGSAVEITLSSREIALIEENNQLDRELYKLARQLFRNQILRALPLILLQIRYFRHKNRIYSRDRRAFEQLRQFEYKRIARWLDLT